MIFHQQSAFESHAQYLFDSCYCFVALGRPAVAKRPYCFLLLQRVTSCTSIYSLTVYMKGLGCNCIFHGLVAVSPLSGTEWKWAREKFSVAECQVKCSTGPRPLHSRTWPYAGLTRWNDIHTGLLTYAYLLLKSSFWTGITDEIGIFFSHVYSDFHYMPPNP